MALVISNIVFTSCEYDYIIYNNNSNTPIDEVPELSNSITSIFTSLLALIGLIKPNRFLYISNMNILFLLGLSSTLHHYFYRNRYFWEADILSIEILILLLEFKLFNYNLSFEKTTDKIINLIFLTNFLITIIYNNVNIGIRTYLIQANIGVIIIKQLINCFVIYKLNDTNFRLYFKSNLVNGIYFTIATTFWYVDKLCIHDLHRIINSHSIWHIFISLSIFNTININNLYISIIDKKKYKIYFLSKKLPYLTYLIFIKEKINTCNSSTYMELKDIILIGSNEKTKHKRIKSYS